MRLADIEKRPFAYSFDSFISCFNPRRVTTSNITITTKASSTLPYLPSFIFLHFTLLPHLFFNHIPFRHPFHIHFITLFPLKTLYGPLLSQLIPLLVHSYLFGREDLLLNSNSKHPCKIIVLLPSSPHLLYHNIPYCHIFFIILNCLKINVVHLILRQLKNIFTTITTLKY